MVLIEHFLPFYHLVPLNPVYTLSLSALVPASLRSHRSWFSSIFFHSPFLSSPVSVLSFLFSAFLRKTTRPFNRVAPFRSCYSPRLFALVLFQLRYFSISDFLTPRFRLPYIRRFLLSPFPPSLPTWRVISRKPWYFVGHGAQSHEGPDEA